MKLSAKSLLLLVVVIAVFASCKKSVPKQIKYIPKDATFVLGINTKSLYEKASKANISLDSVFNTFSKEASNDDITKMKTAIGDLKDAGLDLSEDVYLFVKAGGSIMAGKSVSMGTVALLKDAAKFEAYIKKQRPDAPIKKEAKYSYAALGNDFVAGWGDDVVIISNVSGGKDSPGSYQNGEGTLSQTQLTTLYEQKQEESVGAIAEFRENIKERSDATFWYNSAGLLDAVPMIGITKISDLFKDTYSAGTINFEDGKIVADTKSYYSKALQDILKKYPADDLDIKLVTQYPSNNIDGFFAVSFNPMVLIEILKYSGFEAQANQMLGDFGFTAEDVAKAFKGDIAVTVSDFQILEKPNPYYPAAKSKEPKVNFVFNAKVGDKTAYAKVMGALEKKGLIAKNGNEYRLAAIPMNIPYSIDDKNIMIGQDSILFQKYKAGSGSATLPDEVKKSGGLSLGAYADINKLLQAVPVDSSAKPEQVALFNRAKATFKDIYIAGGKFDGKLSNSKFEVKFIDDKKNSLVSLLQFMAEAAKVAQMASTSSAPAIDSAVPMLPDTSAIPAPPAPEK